MDGLLQAQNYFRRVALAAICIYAVLFPGSVVTVAFNMVPDWGIGMGAGLLILQGLAAGAWLIGYYAWRGAIVATCSFLGAWIVEHIGETTGLPFGRYTYTEMLQPQLFDTVPLAIPCAWLMVVLGAWQLAGEFFHISGKQRPLLVAALVVAIDLQIEPVATQIHTYWIWRDTGFYYGIPLLNFAGWWLVGLLMALPLRYALGTEEIGDWRLAIGKTMNHRQSSIVHRQWWAYLFHYIPTLLFLLSVIMFTIVNLANGFFAAGLIGVALLSCVALAGISGRDRIAYFGRPSADQHDH